jgi:tetratricopeptide (TPR) repeat protein
MKKHVNAKAVLILAGGCLVLGVATHFLHGFQVKRNARGLLEQATVVEQEGQPSKAVEFLDQYLGMVPDDNEALARYGVLLDGLAKTPRARVRAFFVLEQVVRRDGGRSDIRLRVARMATVLGRFQDAKTHLKVLMKETPENAEVMQLLGRCAAGELRYEEAEKWYKKALEKAPDRVELSVEYASLLRDHLDMPGRADERIAFMVRAMEGSATARLAGARYFGRSGLWEQAEQHVQFAMNKLGLQDAEVLLLAADVARAREKPTEARKHLERGLQLYPKDARLSQALTRLDLREGDRRHALQHLQQSLQNTSADPEELWAVAGMFVDAGDLEEAEALGKRLGELGERSAMDCIRAQVLIRRDACGEARQLLERLRLRSDRLPPLLTRQVLYLLAVCYDRLDNPDQRLGAYQQAVAADRKWSAARRGLALSLAALGKLDQAILEYREAAAQDPELRGELVQLLITRNLRLPAAERGWDGVEKLLEEMTAKGEPPRTEVQTLRAQMLVAQDKLAEAQKLLEAERKRDPKQAAPWLLLAGLAQRRGKAEAVLPLLDEAQRQVGRRVEWDQARAGYWARTGGKEAPDRLRKIWDGVEQYPEEDRNRLRLVLADAFLLVQDGASAESLWRQVAERQPSNLSVRERLLERALRAGRDAEVPGLLEEIRRIEGDGGPVAALWEAGWRIAQAQRGDTGKLAEARTLLARAAEQRPSWSRVPLLEAEAYEVENRRDKALEKYQAALTRGEGRAAVVRRVLQLLYEQHRYAEAQTLVRSLPERALAIRELGQMAAALALVGPGRGEGPDGEGREQALHLARKAAADNPQDYRDHLWLGQVAAATGQPEEAERAFRKARELANTVPNTWIALILFLVPRDAKKAEAELKAARTALNKDQLPAVLAVGYEALGRVSDAEEQYLALVAAKPGEPAVMSQIAGFYSRTGQRAKAEPWLRKLIDLPARAPEATVAGARRELALVLAFKGTYPAFQEALKLLEVNAKGSESLEDRRIKALVLATQPARRREAIKLFEQLAGQGPANSPVVQFLLAQLYESDGNWAKARATLVAVLKEQEKNPVFLAVYVRALLRHQEAQEAQTWVDRLAAIAPLVPETVELRVRVLKARGKVQDAVGLVKAYAKEKDARLNLAAQLFDELGQADEAEALYRSLAAASKRPEAGLVLAQQICRRHLPEALALCEQAWKTCPPETVAFTSVAVVRASNSNEEQYQRVKGWLDDALAKHPKSPVVALSFAELLDGHGRHEDAIGLYRRALKQSPENLVALNNLAYLLAMKEGQCAEALVLAQQTLDLAGPDPELLDTRAVIYLKSGQPDLAVQDLQEALAQAPTPSMYFHLAYAQHLVKNRRAALEAFQKGVDSGFKVDTLHPLERPAFTKLSEALGRK